SQTLVDLGKQAKDIDFSQAAFTRPVKVGSALPSTCTVGDLFFNSSASAGANLYTCSSTNAWSAIATGATGGSSGGGASYAADTGAAANVYTVTVSGVTSYTDGLQVLMLPAHSNTAASTVAVSGLARVAIKTQQGLDVTTPGAIRA